MLSLASLFKNNIILDAWSCFCMVSVPLVYMSVIMLGLYCFCYYIFVAYLRISIIIPSVLSFCSELLCILGFLLFPQNFRIVHCSCMKNVVDILMVVAYL